MRNDRGESPADSLAVSIAGVTKRFDGTPVLTDLDLHVEPGEFFTLLGPSGCGKSTLLHIIAGLEVQDSGAVRLGPDDVTSWSPQRRGVGFVFQNYALFPHLSVEENVAFPLRARKVDDRARRTMVGEALELVELTPQAGRHPAQLSGGEQQRVAIARALVFRPKVLLLDEPLSALDKRLRLQLGADLRTIQRDASVTAIYVTHDQDEAFMLSDRIGVMDQGVLRQVGTPDDVYQSPVDLYVARFLGGVNALPGQVVRVAESVRVAVLGGRHVECRPAGASVTAGDSVTVVARPEQVRIGIGRQVTSGVDGDLGPGTVLSVVRLGSRHLVRVALADTVVAVELDPGGHLPSECEEVQVALGKGVGIALRRER